MGCGPSKEGKAAGPVRTEDALLKKVPIVFVLGGPGSGKGTQCDYIIQHFGYTHFSAGDLLRKEVATGSARGAECQRIMTEGALVPVALTLELVHDAMTTALRENHAIKGFLLDGFPRELSQGQAFVKKFRRDCNFVLYFECSEAVMKERIKKRGETSGRADDNDVTIEKRLKTFRDQTVPVVTHYNKLKKLNSISADRTVEEVSVDVDKLFRRFAMEHARIVFVLGGPGSGKGTQCEKIATQCHYIHLSTGDLLRAEVAAHTELGLRCESIMKNGGLVSVDDTLELLHKAMLAAVGPTVRGFLVDGFPREVSQVQAFVHKMGRDCDLALYFECSEEIMTQRILGRGQTSGRADDNAEAAQKRLATFRGQTLPVVAHYRKRHLLRAVSAERPVDDVFQAALESFQ